MWPTIKYFGQNGKKSKLSAWISYDKNLYDTRCSLSFVKRFAEVFAKVETPDQIRMGTFWCDASKQWEFVNNRAKWSFQKKNQIIFSCAKMIFSFFLCTFSFSVWWLQESVACLCTDNLCPLWQFLFLSWSTQTDILKGNPEPTSLNPRGWKWGPLTVQLLCLNEKAWHWQSHTSAVPLPPGCLLESCEHLELAYPPPDQSVLSSSGMSTWQRSGWRKKNKTGKCFCEGRTFLHSPLTANMQVLPAWLALNKCYILACSYSDL